MNNDIGAQCFLNGSPYKIGYLGYVYRHDGVEWVRSLTPRHMVEAASRREILHKTFSKKQLKNLYENTKTIVDDFISGEVDMLGFDGRVAECPEHWSHHA